MANTNINWLAKEIAGRFASYHFTDWSEAVKEAVDAQEETYTDAEIADAETIARRITNTWKKDFDNI